MDEVGVDVGVGCGGGSGDVGSIGVGAEASCSAKPKMSELGKKFGKKRSGARQVQGRCCRGRGHMQPMSSRIGVGVGSGVHGAAVDRARCGLDNGVAPQQVGRERSGVCCAGLCAGSTTVSSGDDDVVGAVNQPKGAVMVGGAGCRRCEAGVMGQVAMRSRSVQRAE